MRFVECAEAYAREAHTDCHHAFISRAFYEYKPSDQYALARDFMNFPCFRPFGETFVQESVLLCYLRLAQGLTVYVQLVE